MVNLTILNLTVVGFAKIILPTISFVMVIFP